MRSKSRETNSITWCVRRGKDARADEHDDTITLRYNASVLLKPFASPAQCGLHNIGEGFTGLGEHNLDLPVSPHAHYDLFQHSAFVPHDI